MPVTPLGLHVFLGQPLLLAAFSMSSLDAPPSCEGEGTHVLALLLTSFCVCVVVTGHGLLLL
jgi:hypothetical protein